MKRRTTLTPDRRSDFKIVTAKRKPFPPRTGIRHAVDTAEIPPAALREIENLKLRVRTLNAINTNLRRELHKLSAQLATDIPKPIAAPNATAVPLKQ